MKNMMIETPEEMFALGETLAKEYPILFVEGELGAGKTTLIKGFAQGLGIDPITVTSPTYAYIQEYQGSLELGVQSSEQKDVISTEMNAVNEVEKSLGGMRSLDSARDDKEKKLLHIDMYNVTNFDELVQKGIVALIHEYDYVVIERPKFVDQLGIDGLSVSIEKLGGDKRKVSL